MPSTNWRRGAADRMLGLVLLLALVAAAAASTDEGCQGKFSLHLAYPESNGQNNNRRRLGNDKRTVYRPQSSRQQQEACMDDKVEEASTVQLRFICNKLKTPIYTHKKILAGNGQPVDVAICRDGEVITSDPLSSVNVEIVALPGDFRPEHNPTAEDFDRQVVISRHGEAGSVLEGLCSRALLDGKCSFDGICFKEGSSRTRTRQFTLAARVVRGQDIGGIRVQEAFMSPVNVKDRRSQANEKSDTPKLNDEVYRLKGIAKNGQYFQRLQKECIRTVQDFLKAYNRDPERLRNILGINSHKSNCWETMTRHALDCDIGDVHKLKKCTIAGRNAALFHNCVHDLVGAEFDGHFFSKEKFHGCQKAFVDKLKEQAYKELEGIELDYVMEDGRPIEISAGINVVFHPPFPIQQPNPPDQHATYQAAENLGPAEINHHITQTHPKPANCNIAARVQGAGGSEPFLLEHHHAYVNEEWAPTCYDSMRASAAREDGPSSSSFYSLDMTPGGTIANEMFRASDHMNQPMFTPSPPYGVVPGSSQDNFYFYGNNQLLEASCSTQNNSLPYLGHDYLPGGETETQAVGILPVDDSIPPRISIQDSPSQTQGSSWADTCLNLSPGSW